MVRSEAMHAFLLRMKVPAESDAVLGGGFRMHATGEVDIRGTFTALAVRPRAPRRRALLVE